MAIGGLSSVGMFNGALGGIAPLGLQGIAASRFASGVGNAQELGVTVTISQAARQALAADPLNQQQGLTAMDILGNITQADSTKKVAQSDTLLALEVLLALLGNGDSSTGNSSQTTLQTAASAIEAYKAMAALGAAV